MAANESSKYTHMSNLSLGTTSGGGDLLIKGVSMAPTVTTVTGATTLTAAQCGVIVLNAAAGAAITLPAATDGYYYKFIVGAAFATSDWVVSSAEGDNLEGCLNINGTLTTVDAADSFTFELAAENIGDFVEIYCDGTTWFVYGVGLNAASLSSTG